MARMPLCECGKGYFSIEDPKLFVRRCNACGQIERPDRTVILGPEPNKYDPDPWSVNPIRKQRR
jgi:hypothetical protein